LFLFIVSLLATACSDTIARLPFLGGPEEIPVAHVALWSPLLPEAEAAQLQTTVDQFVAASEAVSVTLTFVPDYLSALEEASDEESLPDLFVLDSFHFPRWLESGALSRPPRAGVADFYPLLRDGFGDAENSACYPAAVNTLALVYNRDLFDDADLAYPSSAWDWDDLALAAATLTGRPTINYQPYGLVLEADASRWLPFLYQAGGQVVDAEGEPAFDTPQAREALTFYTGLISDTVAIRPVSVESTWAGETFGNRRVGMVIEGNWIVPYLEREFPDLDYGVAPLPAGPGGRATLAFATCYAVATSSQVPDAAHALADALTGFDALGAQIENSPTLPARTSLDGAWNAAYPRLAPFQDGLVDARLWQLPVDLMGLEAIIGEEIDTLLIGDQGIDETLSAIQSGAESLRSR
jgi:multiple sugar transport system substrate-binding protein